MTAGEFISYLNSAGVVGVLAIIILGGWRGWYVWAREFNEMREDRDWWRSTALDGLGAAERSLDLHEQAQRRRLP